MKRLIISSVLCLAVGGLSGCGSEEGPGCQSDKDCRTGLFCQDGVCKCRTDDVCGEGQYCNPFGNCQARPACLGNQDCDAGFICNSADVSGGACIQEDECGSSLHCPFNHYCSAGTKKCEPGCRSTGDCLLGMVCSAGECVAGGTADDCTVCPTNPAPDGSYCDFGEVCLADGSCEPHPQQNGLCERCTPLKACSNRKLICLIDNEEAGKNYCAASCKDVTECPNGYLRCGKIMLVKEKCTPPSTCRNGAPCMGDPESAEAYCGCVNNNECGGGSATCLLGSCSNSGLPCNGPADCSVSCVPVPFEGGTAGVCMTDQGVCGKEQGVTCDELTTTEAVCREL